MNIIIDSNILFSALIKNSSTRKVILDYNDVFLFPVFVFEEMEKHKQELILKSKMKQADFNELFQLLMKKMLVVPNEVLLPYRGKALEIVRKIDIDDAVFIDCAPGLGIEVINSLRACDNAVIVLNPELPSLADACKTIQIAQDLETNILGVIVNRSNRFNQELTEKEIASVIGKIQILGKVPEDSLVSSAISFGQPVLTRYPFSPASHAFKQIAAKLIDKEFDEKLSIIDRFKALLARRS